MTTKNPSSKDYHGLALTIKNQLLLGMIVTLLIGGFAILTGLLVRVSRPELSEDIFLHASVWTLGGIVISSFFTLRLLSRSLNTINHVERGMKTLASTEKPVIAVADIAEFSDDSCSLGEAYRLLLDHLEKEEDLHLDFLSILCHHIRSPLATMINYTELIADPEYGGDSEFFQRSCEVILNQGQKICNFTDDVLLAASLEASRFEFKKDLIRLDSFLAQIVEETENLFTRDVHYSNQMGEVVIWGDALRLRKALLTVIENLLNDTEQNIPLSIQLRANAGPNNIEISISNPEKSFDPRDEVHIFQYLHPSKNMQPREIRGAWFGFYIANKIFEAHQGVTSFHSTMERGSTFRISLPVANEKQQAQLEVAV